MMFALILLKAMPSSSHLPALELLVLIVLQVLILVFYSLELAAHKSQRLHGLKLKKKLLKYHTQKYSLNI